MNQRSVAFGDGSVSFKPYIAGDTAADVIQDFLTQVDLVEQSGFDGLVVSEHHDGFPGYLPNPLQAATWALERTTRIWAGPCPMLVLLRPVALTCEELAWLAARHPGRVGAGFAAGSIATDFALAGTDQNDLATRFRGALADATTILSGTLPTPFTRDRAIDALAQHPIPVVSAASSSHACKRAAAIGCGLLLESHTSLDYTRRFVDTYRDAGGTGPVVLNRRVWVGTMPDRLQEQQIDLYRNAVPDYDRRSWLPAQDMLISGDPAQVASELDEFLDASGATAVTLRVHVEGLTRDAVYDQIRIIGTDVLPALRAGRWAANVAATSGAR